MASSESLTGVVHVSFGLEVGGQEKLLVEFARHVRRSQFALTFVSLGHRGALAEDIEACGWPVVALGKAAGLRPRIVTELASLFWHLRPGVVHTHDNRSLIYAAPAARLARVPRAVHTRHGRNVSSTPRQIRVVRLLSRLVDDYVCVSRDAAALSLVEGIPVARLRKIYNGIDLERFAFSGPCPRGPVVAVARLSPEKDMANLVQAAAIAVRQDPELRFEVAGDGRCLPDLQRQIADLCLEDHVKLLGTIRDIPALLARASLFVLPSRSEGISLTLLEAMARGLPVAATKVGGNPEVIIEGETGLLVPSQDPRSLALAILSLREDFPTAREMGVAGRHRVERDFDIRRMMMEYEALYRVPGSAKTHTANDSDLDGTAEKHEEPCTAVATSKP